jgi:hypothetical protein
MSELNSRQVDDAMPVVSFHAVAAVLLHVHIEQLKAISTIREPVINFTHLATVNIIYSILKSILINNHNKKRPFL